MINAVPTSTDPTQNSSNGYQPPSAAVPGVASYSPLTPGLPPAAAGVLPTAAAPFNTQPKKKVPFQYIIAGLAMLLLVIGGGSAYFLSQTSQDVRNQAAGENDPYNGACTSDANCASGYTCFKDPADNNKVCMPISKSCEEAGVVLEERTCYY